MAYFGLWAEEGRRDEMAAAAISILEGAIGRCIDCDVRSAEIDQVLAWIERHSTRANPVQRFRDALLVVPPQERKAALTDAYVRILRELGFYRGRL